jgi:tetratricopeptide (TPR) repeat protein
VVPVVNLLDNGTGGSYETQYMRFWRRGRAEWHGRVHEQLVPVPADRPLQTAVTEPAMRLLHQGYLTARVEARGKTERNVALAASMLDDESSGRARADRLLEYGRTLAAAERHDEAVAHFAEAMAEGLAPWARRRALRHQISSLMALGRDAEALDLVAALRACSSSGAMADFLEGQARLHLGDAAGALTVLGPLTEVVDDDGYRPPAALLHLQRGIAYAVADQWDDAAAELARAVADHGAVHGNLGLLVDTWVRSGRPLAALGHVLEAEDVVDELCDLPAPTAIALCDAMGDQLSIDDVLACALRIESPEPLLERHGDANDRLLAAALAARAFDDDAVLDRARHVVAAASGEVNAGRFTAVLADLSDVCPAVLPAFIEGSLTSPARAVAMSDALRALGADEQADGILRYADLL